MSGEATDGDRDLWVALWNYFRDEAEQIKMENGPVAVRRYRIRRRIVDILAKRYDIKKDDESAR